ncbi:hypothetical protein RMCBS344292_09050 [Rhizopus microsporus]|nr:hypothetical protein RMCBS344292_09050 [Rhizopus microsporus]
MPHLDGVKPGDKVNMTIKMYFGLTEIKIECIIRDKSFTFTSSFDAADTLTDNYPQQAQQDPYYYQQTPIMNSNQVYGVNDLTNSMSHVSLQQQPSTYSSYPPATSQPYNQSYYPPNNNYDYYAQTTYPQQQQPQQGYSSYYGGANGSQGGYSPNAAHGYPPQQQQPPGYGNYH